jgi:hypothetical protein
MRTITVNDIEYEWKVGKSCISIRNRNLKISVSPFCSDVKGITAYAYERGHWKRTADGMVMPHEVAKWIESNLQL